MELARIFDACQGDRLDEWRVVPGGDVPDTNLLAALVDVGDQSGPALATLPHLHRGVCVPDARLGLGWGMDPEEWRDRRPKGKPDWASPQWSNAKPSVRPPAAPVLRRMQASWQAPAPARSGTTWRRLGRSAASHRDARRAGGDARRARAKIRRGRPRPGGRESGGFPASNRPLSPPAVGRSGRSRATGGASHDGRRPR
jgi:hypothetical protein